MIEITEGFTSISAGADAIEPPPWPDAGDSRTPSRRALTGARVTLEFSRAAALPPHQPVRVRYEFDGGGTVREFDGIPKPTHVDTLWGRAVIYHYRLSHWIAPDALMSSVARNVRQRTEEVKRPRHDSVQRSSVTE